jgi:quercetin dioxygenase-like cupin family protein
MDRNKMIESGLLELYAMGSLGEEDRAKVNAVLANDPLLAGEVKAMEQALSMYAQAHAVTPPAAVKPLLMAKLEYLDRLKAGEIPAHPPILTASSNIGDFDQWLQREDMVLPPDFEAIHVSIVADEPEKLTAIVWLKYGAPEEVHTTAHEKFLVVEGSCNIVVEGKVHSLSTGDYFSIPLNQRHHVEVTSAEPCKIILQRVAA